MENVQAVKSGKMKWNEKKWSETVGYFHRILNWNEKICGVVVFIGREMRDREWSSANMEMRQFFFGLSTNVFILKNRSIIQLQAKMIISTYHDLYSFAWPTPGWNESSKKYLEIYLKNTLIVRSTALQQLKPASVTSRTSDDRNVYLFRTQTFAQLRKSIDCNLSIRVEIIWNSHHSILFSDSCGTSIQMKRKKQKTILIRSKRICTSQSDLCKFFNKSFSIFATLSSFFDSIIYPIWLANKYSMWNLFGYVENELENFSNNFTSETTNFSSFHEYTKFPYQLPNNSSLWGHQESVYFIILAF